MNIKKSSVLFFVLFSLCSACIFGQSNQTKSTDPEPYNQNEFSQPLQDLRRFEIITLGSMPFVTMDTAIVFNGIKFATGKSQTFNPLATADYSPQEMKTVILTSLCISAGIGITDFVIRVIKRNIKGKDVDLSDAIKIEVEPQEESE
jgi:hypothetical protein